MKSRTIVKITKKQSAQREYLHAEGLKERDLKRTALAVYRPLGAVHEESIAVPMSNLSS